MTLNNNKARFLINIKLCASFHRHMWIQTGVTVRKPVNWVLTSVTLTFYLWPWPFVWQSLLALVITPANFMMIRLWKRNEKGVRDGWTDEQTDGQIETFIDCLVTTKNNRKPLVCYFKLCAPFHSYRWIKTGVTVWKRPIRRQNRRYFCPMWRWNLTDDLEKQ